MFNAPLSDRNRLHCELFLRILHARVPFPTSEFFPHSPESVLQAFNEFRIRSLAVRLASYGLGSAGWLAGRPLARSLGRVGLRRKIIFSPEQLVMDAGANFACDLVRQAWSRSFRCCCRNRHSQQLACWLTLLFLRLRLYQSVRSAIFFLQKQPLFILAHIVLTSPLSLVTPHVPSPSSQWSQGFCASSPGCEETAGKGEEIEISFLLVAT